MPACELNFYEWQKHAGGDFATAQQLSFTNPGVAYDYEHKTRSEVFNMNEIVAERKDVFINFRQDILAKSAFADTWDLSDFRGKSYDEISELFYDLSSAEKKARVWLDIPKNNGTLNYDTQLSQHKFWNNPLIYCRAACKNRHLLHPCVKLK